MCGRYVATTDADGLVTFFVIDDRDPAAKAEYVRWHGAARYNVAPTDPVPAVVRHDGHRVLTELRWGLVPFWASDRKVGSKMINARAESITTKSAFKDSFERRRCLIPADGFYEWEKVNGQRLPWFVHRSDGDPMVFAGIWSSWRDKADQQSPRLLTCSVITTRANGVLEPIHDRMPAILDRTVWDAWLDPDTAVGDLHELLGPAPEEDVLRHRVSTRVNSVANDEPDLVLPITDDEETPPIQTVGPAHPAIITAAGDPQPSLFD